MKQARVKQGSEMEQEVFYRAKGQGLGFKDLVSLHNTTGDLWAKRGERSVLRTARDET